MDTKQNLLDVVNEKARFTLRGTGKLNERLSIKEFSCAGLIFNEAKKIGAMEEYIPVKKLYDFINNPSDINDLKEGDILFTDNHTHCGIYVGNGEVIQSLLFLGVVKSKLTSMKWTSAARPTWKGWFDNE